MALWVGVGVDDPLETRRASTDTTGRVNKSTRIYSTAASRLSASVRGQAWAAAVATQRPLSITLIGATESRRRGASSRVSVELHM